MVFILEESCGEAISFFPPPLFLGDFFVISYLYFPLQKCQRDVVGAEHILSCDRYHLTPIYERQERDTSPQHDMNTLSPPPTCNVFSFGESEESLKERDHSILEALNKELINTLSTCGCPSLRSLLPSSDGAKVMDKRKKNIKHKNQMEQK